MRRSRPPIECDSARRSLSETRRRPKHVSEPVPNERAIPETEVAASVSPEQRKAAREQRKAARSERQIRIGQYTVRQCDELNWAVERAGTAPHYTSDLPGALRLLLRMTIGDKARSDIKGCLQAIKDAEERILKAIA